MELKESLSADIIVQIVIEFLQETSSRFYTIALFLYPL